MFKELFTEAKAKDMDIKDIKALIIKAFPKASEEEINTYFREVYSYISRMPNMNITVKSIKNIIDGN